MSEEATSPKELLATLNAAICAAAALRLASAVVAARGTGLGLAATATPSRGTTSEELLELTTECISKPQVLEFIL